MIHYGKLTKINMYDLWNSAVIGNLHWPSKLLLTFS